MTRIIEVKRKVQFGGVAVKYTVNLDGIPVGQLAAGKSLQLQADEQAHELEVSMKPPGRSPVTGVAFISPGTENYVYEAKVKAKDAFTNGMVLTCVSPRSVPGQGTVGQRPAVPPVPPAPPAAARRNELDDYRPGGMRRRNVNDYVGDDFKPATATPEERRIVESYLVGYRLAQLIVEALNFDSEKYRKYHEETKDSPWKLTRVLFDYEIGETSCKYKISSYAAAPSADLPEQLVAENPYEDSFDLMAGHEIWSSGLDRGLINDFALTAVADALPQVMLSGTTLTAVTPREWQR